MSAKQISAADPARTLRRLFLTLFLRGRSSRGLRKNSAPGSVASKLKLVLLLYALIGAIAFVYWRQPIFVLSAGLHAMTFLFVGLSIASSAGEVLFNQQESDILLHRPITPQALLWAKIAVLVQVSLWLAGVFNLSGLIVGTMSAVGGWWYLPAHGVSTILETLFCTGSIVLIYQLCLRWLGRERFEGIVTSVQVAATLAFVLAGQILPRLLIRLSEVHFNSSTWALLLLPPAWFAGFDDALAGTHAAGSWVLAVVGIGATAAVLWGAFGKLADEYAAGLQRLSESTGAAGGRSSKGRWTDRLVRVPPLSWWLRDPVERAVFTLSFAYLLRDRDVKLRVYPSIAPILVLPLLVFLNGSGRQPFDVAGIYTAFAGLFFGQAPMMTLMILQYSQQWQAADLYRLVPVAGPVPFCQGARKAVQVFLLLPLLLSALVIGWHDREHLERLALLLPGLIAFPVYSLLPCVDGKAVPLALPTEEARSVGRGLSLVGTMIISMILAFVAFFAWRGGWFRYFLAAETLVAIIFYVMFRRESHGVRWPSLE